MCAARHMAPVVIIQPCTEMCVRTVVVVVVVDDTIRRLSPTASELQTHKRKYTHIDTHPIMINTSKICWACYGGRANDHYTRIISIHPKQSASEMGKRGRQNTHTHTRTQTLSADTHSLILDRPPARPTLDHLLLNIDERVLDNHSGVYVRARIVFEKPELG